MNVKIFYQSLTENEKERLYRELIKFTPPKETQATLFPASPGYVTIEDLMNSKEISGRLRNCLTSYRDRKFKGANVALSQIALQDLKRQKRFGETLAAEFTKLRGY